jgi:hypothetical protein
MSTNAAVLIVVTALAALVLSGALAVVISKTRTSRRHLGGTRIGDQAEEGALRLQRQEALADEMDARVHAAQLEIDIKTGRACSLRKRATVQRSEADSARDQLNHLRDQADGFGAAAQTRQLPRPIGPTTQ